MGKFQKIYRAILQQQKLTFKKNIISEGFFDSLKEVGNIVGGVGDALTALPKGEFKAVGKGLWKSLSAPIGAITELGQPSIDDLNKEYEEIKKLDFEKEENLKSAMEATKNITDDKIIDEFTNWSEAGKEFVENLKKELKEDDKKIKSVLRKILALRNHNKKLKEELKKAKEEEAKNKETQDEGQDEDETDNKELTKELKDIFVEITNKGDLFDKRLAENKVLIVKSNGKIGRYPLEEVKKNKEKYVKFATACKDKAKAARKK